MGFRQQLKSEFLSQISGLFSTTPSLFYGLNSDLKKNQNIIKFNTTTSIIKKKNPYKPFIKCGLLTDSQKIKTPQCQTWVIFKFNLV